MSKNGDSSMTSGPIQRKFADPYSNGPIETHKYIFKLYPMLAVHGKYCSACTFFLCFILFFMIYIIIYLTATKKAWLYQDSIVW